MAEIAGLKLIVPSSVSATGAGSSASIVGGGKVVFTTIDTLTIEGIFSATYDNYLMVIRAHQPSGSFAISLNARLRVSGSDASGSNYTWQILQASSTTISGSRSSSQTSARMGEISQNQRSGNHAYIYGPYLSQPTAFRGVNAGADGNASIADYASTHSLSTSYTGITLLPGGGSYSTTGTVQVFGLSQ
jgi:hypothetical protein